ncbi:5-guanidino-2-oxopentanoate decarboxylase [Rhizomonospora bruguierae]|uniref:5-guanidino-2-oxopentanoate decarboxylase n=1 Tax=Rhizomonospora bruguierae TaxID=1581705 RepID=UPI001BCB317F|nr:5-guanidino-2-oxopentanoate decarboxylase [Micromonospora sp. NBRC 107566]
MAGTGVPGAGAGGRTAGELLVAGLAVHGVDLVFGIPGTHNLEIYRHLAAYGIRHVTPRHEQGAGYAADGYARATGRPGVALVTTGPALLNIAAAVGQAYSDSVPVLVVSPGMPLRHPQRGTGMLHEMRDQRAAMSAVARLSHRVTTHEELAAAVAQAFAEFAVERPRPVHLEIPLDLLGETGKVEPIGPIGIRRRVAAPATVTEAARALAAAERPGILAGGGARAAAEPLRTLAERLGAGVLTTANGKGTLPEEHPLAVTSALHLPGAAEFVADRDVLLAVGTEVAPTDWWYAPMPRPRKLIRIDLEPAQLAVNARPDIALAGDAAATLWSILEGVPGAAPSDAAPWRARLRAQARVEAARWLPWLDALAASLDRDATVVADTAMASYYGALGALPAHVPGGFLYPTGFGTLGYAVPAAIGVKLARPERQVLALSGDGGLMFSVAELATAAAERVPLPVLVFVNGGYGEIRAEMRDAGIAPFAVDLPVPDLAGLAAALGGRGVPLADPADLPGALAAALVHPGPTLLIAPEED